MGYRKLKFCLSFMLALTSCAVSSEDTAYYEPAEDDKFVNTWVSLDTNNVILNQVMSDSTCYRFYEFTSETYGDYRKLYGRDSLEEGSYFVADWERTGTDSILISEKYELIYEKHGECYSLLAYSSIMTAEGVACPCETPEDD